MRTRGAVAAQRAEDFSETDADKEVKDRFLQLEVIGDKLGISSIGKLVKRHISFTPDTPKIDLHIRILSRYIHPCPYVSTTTRLTKSMYIYGQARFALSERKMISLSALPRTSTRWIQT